MDKSIAGLIGAVSALALAAPAAAAPLQPASMAAAMEANSYSDLLKPIPNAAELLKASAAVPVPGTTSADPNVEKAQVYLQFGPRRRPDYYYYHHHHHHHHHYYYHHHHHHHHHQ